MNGTLSYWTPRDAAPSRGLPPQEWRLWQDRSERMDWLTMLVVVSTAAAGAFSIVFALAWVLGG